MPSPQSTVELSRQPSLQHAPMGVHPIRQQFPLFSALSNSYESGARDDDSVVHRHTCSRRSYNQGVDHREPISPDALKLLVASHDRFLSFLERRLCSREVAEDLLQQAFVRGIERGGAIRDGESAVAWFYRLLRNAVVDHARRTGTANGVLRRWAEELGASQPVDESLHRTICACVSRLVDTLKPEYASAIRAVDVEGKPVGELAKQAGISPNSAGVRLHRARAALGERVRASCGPCASDGCIDCTCA